MSNNSLYDEWDWADISYSGPDMEEERYEPDRPTDDEFYWAERLKKKNQDKIAAHTPNKQPDFLQIWDGPDQTRPIVAKRSDGYKAPASPIGTIARMPTVPQTASVPKQQQPYNPYKELQNQPQQQPQINHQSPYVNQYSQQQPQTSGYTYTEIPLVSDIDASTVTYDDIANDRFKSTIPAIPEEEKIRAHVAPRVPEFKVSRQLFLMVNAVKLSSTIEPSQLKALIKKIIECTIPVDDSENEICLYNADESVKQLVGQIVSTREESDRLILLDGVRRILDMYLPTETSAKEFVKANGATYPHPAYVGLQASLDALHYIAIWCANLEAKDRGSQVPITRAISDYIYKYKNRLSKLPRDIGSDTTQSILYYE